MNDKTSIGCPYLGILADPQTRIEHADELNHCFCKKKPQSVSLSHQEDYCIGDNFNQCKIYKSYINKLEAKNKSLLISKPKILSRGIFAFRNEKRKQKEQQNFSKDQEKIELPQKSNDDWKKRLHNEAQTNYDDIATQKSSGWVWGLLLVFALVVFVGLIWLNWNKGKDVRAQAQPGNTDSSQGSLATTVSQLSGAADTWATAANVLEISSQAEATRAAATAMALDLEAEQALTVEETPMDNFADACADLDEIQYEIVEGPVLSPDQGYYYVIGSPKPDIYASWLIENTGNCNWETISFLSLIDGSTVKPEFKKDGQELDLTTTGGKFLIGPEEQIEITIPYDVTEARDVNDEFIVMVNGISLVSHPHTIIVVNGWVISIKSQNIITPTPSTSEPKDKPTSVSPPSDRPSPTPPGRGG